jgi:hypothetical protein
LVADIFALMVGAAGPVVQIATATITALIVLMLIIADVWSIFD